MVRYVRIYLLREKLFTTAVWQWGWGKLDKIHFFFLSRDFLPQRPKPWVE